MFLFVEITHKYSGVMGSATIAKWLGGGEGQFFIVSLQLFCKFENKILFKDNRHFYTSLDH